MLRPARVLLLVLGLVTTLGLTSCSSSGGTSASGSLGHTTATVAELDPTPVVARATPQLPVTVRGFDGRDGDGLQACRVGRRRRWSP